MSAQSYLWLSGSTRERPWRHLAKCGVSPRGSAIVSFYGCNLKCPFCFASTYSYEDRRYSSHWPDAIKTPERTGSYRIPHVDSLLRGDKDKTVFDPEIAANSIVEWCQERGELCYVQLTGGEPMLSVAQASGIVRFLVLLSEASDALGYKQRVIWQTNGGIAGRRWDQLSEILRPLHELAGIYVLFEVSLKGTNSEEFALLSGTGSSGPYAATLDGYWRLREFTSGHAETNLGAVARLGVGHHEKTLTYVYPDRPDTLMFLETNWSNEFRNLHAESSSDGKLVAETTNTTVGDFGTMIYRWFPGIVRLALLGCVVDRSEPPESSGALSTFHCGRRPCPHSVRPPRDRCATSIKMISPSCSSRWGRQDTPTVERATFP